MRKGESAGGREEGDIGSYQFSMKVSVQMTNYFLDQLSGDRSLIGFTLRPCLSPINPPANVVFMSRPYRASKAMKSKFVGI